MIYYNHQLRIQVFLISLIFNSSSFDPSSSLTTSHQSFWPLMKDADGCVIESTFFPRKCVYLANRFLIDDSYLGRNIQRPQCWDGAVWRGEAHTQNVQTLTAHTWNLHKANGSVLSVTIWCVTWVSVQIVEVGKYVVAVVAVAGLRICYISGGPPESWMFWKPRMWFGPYLVYKGYILPSGSNWMIICYLPPFARTWRICWNLVEICTSMSRR